MQMERLQEMCLNTVVRTDLDVLCFTKTVKNNYPIFRSFGAPDISGAPTGDVIRFETET